MGHELRVFEDSVLRELSGPKREEVTGHLSVTIGTAYQGECDGWRMWHVWGRRNGKT